MKGCVLPDSAGFGSVNIIGSILKHFGAKSPHGPLDSSVLDPTLLRGVRNIVLIVVDGLGYNTIINSSKFRKLGLGKLIRKTKPITTTAPSTTVTALTSFGTGCVPLEHGIMGYNQYVKRLGMVTNMLRFKPAAGGGYLDRKYEPQWFQSNKSVFAHLARKGVKGYSILRPEYLNSPLTRMSRGMGLEGIGYVNSSDMFVHTRNVLKSRRGKKSFVSVYWDKTDPSSHAYGYKSDEMIAEVANFDFSLFSELLDHRIPGTLVLITADHGHMTSTPKKSVVFNNHPKLMDMLVLPPSGESRLCYLHVRNGMFGHVMTYLKNSIFGKHFHILPSENAIENGVFGPGKPCPMALDALGDIVLIPKKDWYAYYDFCPEKPRGGMIGRHGGLSAEEMEIPLLAVWL